MEYGGKQVWKRKDLDIKAFEITSGRQTLKRSLEELNLSNPPVDQDYLTFLKNLLLESGTSSSLSEGDDDSDVEDDVDPQYMMFLENLREDGQSYKLEIELKNRMVSVLYEGEDDSDDECGMHSSINLKNEKNVEKEENHIIENDTGIDLENNRGREKRKSEERDLKSKRRKCGQAKNNDCSGKKASGKWNNIFGYDWQKELNADDVDECYRIFLNSVKIEGDCLIYAFEGLHPVKHEEFDVEFSSDSEVLVTKNASNLKEGGCNPLQTTKLVVTPQTEQQCLRSRGGDIDSVFRKKLMAILGKPYDDREYKKLWNEINEEKPKEKHYDLRGSGVKTFRRSELSPSYLAKHAGLRRKINAVGNDRRKKLYYLRGFFFWLQNLAHEDSFRPWNDKSCLEVMSKIC